MSSAPTSGQRIARGEHVGRCVAQHFFALEVTRTERIGVCYHTGNNAVVTAGFQTAVACAVMRQHLVARALRGRSHVSKAAQTRAHRRQQRAVLSDFVEVDRVAAVTGFEPGHEHVGAGQHGDGLRPVRLAKPRSIMRSKQAFGAFQPRHGSTRCLGFDIRVGNAVVNATVCIKHDGTATFVDLNIVEVEQVAVRRAGRALVANHAALNGVAVSDVGGAPRLPVVECHGYINVPHCIIGLICAQRARRGCAQEGKGRAIGIAGDHLRETLPF